jgi:hypothetical protein
VVEGVAVGGMRAAVNVQDERIFLAGLKIGRALHPGLYAPAVEALVPDGLGRGEIELGEQIVVHVREAAGGPLRHLAGTGRRCWWASRSSTAAFDPSGVALYEKTSDRRW